jgi:crotonobetainyl-CoA:carnitine CoA-transferase CaiB-like acyl-CoA transferase
MPALPWPGLQNARPLAGLRVLDLTRILAGPVAGRTLAAYGADVMLVNSPHLPNIDASRGQPGQAVHMRI